MRITDEPVYRQLFGSKLKQRILKYLYSDQTPVSEREMARLLNKSHTAVNKAMKQLLEMNAVKGITVGRAGVWALNKSSFAFPLIQTYFDKLNVSPLGFIRKELADAIVGISLGDAKKKGQKIEAVYIFGSVAEGTSRTDSDIDVMVVLESDYKNDELARKLQTAIGMKILEKTGNLAAFHIYSQDAVRKNQPHWLKDAIAKGIRVF